MRFRARDDETMSPMSEAPHPTWASMATIDARAGDAISALQAEDSSGWESATETIDALVADLLTALLAADPLSLIGRLAFLVQTSGAQRNFTAAWGSEARIQYLTAVAISAAFPSAEAPSPADVQIVIDVTHSIFQLETALLLNRSRQQDSDSTRLLLQQERLQDRFQGYERHLNRVIATMYEPVRKEFERSIGWCPSDLPELRRGVSRILNERMTEFWEPARRSIREYPAGSDQAVRHYEALAAPFTAQLYRFTPQQIAERCNLGTAQVDTILGYLSMTLDESGSYRRPSQDNPFRASGVVHVRGDQYFIPIAASLIQELPLSFPAVLRRRGDESLIDLVHRRRDDATEALTVKVLAAVFDERRVTRSCRYTKDNVDYEVDAVVVIPDDVLIVECKAHSLTDAGRRGAPDRVRDQAKRLIRAPLEQAGRCAAVLRNGGQLRDASGKPVETDVSDDSLLARMAVSYERIDPLSIDVAASAMKAGVPIAWLVPVVDLMMVGEILDDPGSFWHYALLRMRLASDERIRVISEADVLGLYIAGYSAQLEELSRHNPGKGVSVGPWADTINDYFARPSGLAPMRKPRSPVPLDVAKALSRALEADRADWKHLVDGVCSQPPSTWRRWRKVTRKGRRAVRNRSSQDRIFDIVEPRLRLVYPVPERMSTDVEWGTLIVPPVNAH